MTTQSGIKERRRQQRCSSHFCQQCGQFARGRIKTALGDTADLYEITPEVPYTADDLNYDTDCPANDEQNDDSARPAIAGSVEDSASLSGGGRHPRSSTPFWRVATGREKR